MGKIMIKPIALAIRTAFPQPYASPSIAWTHLWGPSRKEISKHIGVQLKKLMETHHV